MDYYLLILLIFVTYLAIRNVLVMYNTNKAINYYYNVKPVDVEYCNILFTLRTYLLNMFNPLKWTVKQMYPEVYEHTKNSSA